MLHVFSGPVYRVTSSIARIGVGNVLGLWPLQKKFGAFGDYLYLCHRF